MNIPEDDIEKNNYTDAMAIMGGEVLSTRTSTKPDT